MTGATITVAQTLPRTHRCDATIGQAPGEFGFVPVACTQRVGVRTFTSTSGLLVGYCPIEGHEASVRRRFVERTGAAVRPPILVAECPSCIDRAATGSGPAHEASQRCESGRRPHCTCDVCW